MRLIHAVTASDFQNSGHNYGAQNAQWARIAKLPVYMYAGAGGLAQADPAGVRFTGGPVYFSLPVGRAMQHMAENEVIGCGQYVAPVGTARLPNAMRTFLRVSSSVGEENLFFYADTFKYLTSGLAMFVEYVASYDLKTWSLYVNGRFIKSVQATMDHDRASLVFYFNSVNSASGYFTLRDVYAAFFDPAVEKPSLGRWTCEALLVGASQFPNSVAEDSVMDTLGVPAKTIEFTYAGTRKLESAMLAGTCKGPFVDALDVAITSGSNHRTTSMIDTPVIGASDTWTSTGNGIATPLGSVDFDNVSKKLTASLNMQP